MSARAAGPGHIRREKMQSRRYSARRKRTNRGAGIAEFGPGFFVLLICIFFPLVDLISIGVSYCLLMVLNYNQIQQASLVQHQEAQDPSGAVKKGIPDTWKNGMGRFVNMSGNVQTQITYRDGQTETGAGANGAQDKIVRLRTTVNCNPFLPIPFFFGIPGINATYPLVVFQERQMENPDYAP